MSKYKYVGECAAGQVTFSRPTEDPVVMPTGEAVEVPDWLAKKLSTISHFEKVGAGAKVAAPPDDTVDVPGAAETGECPDCGKNVKVRKDGYLYSHKCVGD